MLPHGRYGTSNTLKRRPWTVEVWSRRANPEVFSFLVSENPHTHVVEVFSEPKTRPKRRKVPGGSGMFFLSPQKMSKRMSHPKAKSQTPKG